MTSLPFVIVVVGPTASGKSDLAQRIGLKLNGEVVSADSMQIYKGMDIGTGKVLPEHRMVPHHGLDIVDPGQPYSAALYQDYARIAFEDIRSRGCTPILCGGTGFYVRAAMDDYRFPAGEQVGNETRDRCNGYVESYGATALWELLRQRDPDSAAIIPSADVKRVVRAFELLETGTTYARQRSQLAHIKQVIPGVFIGLKVEPSLLRERINRRVDGMFEQGLVQEVQRLLNEGFRDGITSPQAIGYKEVVAALDGQISLDEARAKIKVATHRYAKRQRTWFRKDRRICVIDADDGDFDRMEKEALRIIDERSDTFERSGSMLDA